MGRDPHLGPEPRGRVRRGQPSGWYGRVRLGPRVDHSSQHTQHTNSTLSSACCLAMRHPGPRPPVWRVPPHRQADLRGGAPANGSASVGVRTDPRWPWRRHLVRVSGRLRQGRRQHPGAPWAGSAAIAAASQGIGLPGRLSWTAVRRAPKPAGADKSRLPHPSEGTGLARRSVQHPTTDFGSRTRDGRTVALSIQALGLPVKRIHELTVVFLGQHIAVEMASDVLSGPGADVLRLPFRLDLVEAPHPIRQGRRAFGLDG